MNQILLDFYSGSHGQFLEYVINTYIFRGPKLDNIFTPLGTCHMPNKDAEYKSKKVVRCGHFSEFGTDLDAKPEKVIRIGIRSPLEKVIYQINVDHRAGDIPAEKKQQYMPDSVRQSPLLLRENYYSKLCDFESGYQLPTEWQYDTAQVYEFPMESLFDLTCLYTELKHTARFLEHTWNPDPSLVELWKKFVEYNHGLQAWKKCNHILELSLASKSMDFTCTPWEQALLMWLLSETIGIVLENEQFPTNTLHISQQIKHYIDTFDTNF